MHSLFLIFYLLVPPTTGHLCTENDLDFDGLSYEEQIPHCTRNVTTERKIEICKRDGVEDRTEYTVDHIIPLAVGGSNDDDNLWCQHYTLAVTDLERKMYLAMSRNEISQKDAIAKILFAKQHPRP